MCTPTQACCQTKSFAIALGSCPSTQTHGSFSSWRRKVGCFLRLHLLCLCLCTHHFCVHITHAYSSILLMPLPAANVNMHTRTQQGSEYVANDLNTLVFNLDVECKKRPNAAPGETDPDKKYINHLGMAHGSVCLCLCLCLCLCARTTQHRAVPTRCVSLCSFVQGPAVGSTG